VNSPCDIKTERKTQLTSHQNSIHDTFSIPCNQCNFKATDEDSLKNAIEHLVHVSKNDESISDEWLDESEFNISQVKIKVGS